MSKQIKLQYAKLSERFEQLSLREQIMVFLCGVTLAAFVGYFVVLDPQWQSNKKIPKKSLNSPLGRLTIRLLFMSL